MYCKKSDHRSADCQTVKTTSERRTLLSEKQLCFSCTTPKDCAADCRSSKTCLICKNKHHTFICDKSSSTSTEPLLTTTENNVIYPVVIIKINGVKNHAPLDMSFGSSYALEAPFRLFENRPNRKRNKNNQELNKLKNLSFVLSKYKIILGLMISLKLKWRKVYGLEK